MSRRDEQKIIGEIGQGVDGRTLRLKINSRQAAQWLRSVFYGMASTPTILLSAQPEIEINDLEGLELVCVSRRPARHVREGPRGHFVWSGTPDDWETAARLMDPFAEGQHGHQYLTNEVGGDLGIEVSLGESP